MIGPNFIHSAYLINMASSVPEILDKSVQWLIYSQKTAARLGMAGTIFHVGSHKENDPEKVFSRIIKAISGIIAETKEQTIIMENSAGAGNLIGDKFSELGKIIKTVGDPGLKVCLDTQHSFASAYDWRTPEGTNKALTEFDREIGLEKLAVIHANDSMTELGSNRDRHANIGEGFISLAGFRNIINHPAFADIPFILEVPGFADDGPDKENITLLKKLVRY